MAHSEEPSPPGEPDLIDAWIEHALSQRPLQAGTERELSAPRLVQQLEDFYREEAQAVERRLEQVWERLWQHAVMRQSRPEALPQALPVWQGERRSYQMKASWFEFGERRQMKVAWSQFRERHRGLRRLSTLAAAVLLVALVGGLIAGLVLVRHGGKPTQATGPTATPFLPPTPTVPASTGALLFSEIVMKDAREGWATAYHFPLVDNAPLIILHTSDGGIHWNTVTPKSSALAAASSNALARPFSNGAGVRTEDFLTGSLAWVLQLPNHLFRTTDGGQTWQEKTIPGEAIRQFTFLDDLNGWVITQDAGAVVVFRTSDGGATWTRMQHNGSAFRLQDAFWGVRFLNKTTGWAVFINNTVGNSAVMYKTTDGGATWRYQQIVLPAGVVPPVFPSAPVFFNDKEGVMEVMFADVRQLRANAMTIPASGGSPEGLYVTHNGGASWEGPIMLNGLEFPDFIDALHGWALNSTGSGLLTTSDSGRHWASVTTSPNFSQIEALNFVSSQVGWALKFDQATQAMLILKTEDGGQTWTQLDIEISS